jgi:uncharacterized membrane protein HdeD (DUF308 family)
LENRVPTTGPWSVWAVSGVVSILFGILALAWPGVTLSVLVWLWGAFALVYGIVQLIGIFRAIGAGTTWWTYLLVGVASVVAGLYVLFYPLVSAAVLAFVIGFWAVAVGTIEIVTGIGRGNLLTIVTGVIAVVFGFVMLGNPMAGALALVWVIGVFAIVRGIVLLVGAFRAPAGGGAPTPR